MDGGIDFAKLVVYQARAHRDDPAVVSPGGVATYSIFASAMLSAADRLSGLHLPPGAIVGVDVGNPVQHLVLMFALNLCGLASASIQTSFNVEQSGLTPAAVLTDGRSQHPAGLNLLLVDESWFTVDPSVPPDFERLLGFPGFRSEDDVMRVIFSSGTTGVPKSAGITSKVLARRFNHSLFVIPGDRVRSLTLLGLSTLGGFLSPVFALGTGGVACLASTPPEALHLVRMFDIDTLTVAVFQLQAIIKALGDAPPPPSLKKLIVGGSRIPQDLAREARARICPNLIFSYGSSEAGIVAIGHGSHLEGIDGAAGFLLPWMELEAVDEDGNRLPAGVEGILRTRSDELAHYVVNDPDTALLFRDGWFYPGDIGSVRGDGMVVITGRSSEVINRGGSIIAPELIERVLLSHPDVSEAAAFGVPVRPGIEEIWAAVITKGPLDEEKLKAYCRQRLAEKTPDVIRSVTSIPRTSTAKIKRGQLRAEVTALAPT
jgi:acyl-coenzyme A synthetase/AMP-(fatty) acid ligase